MPRLLLLLLPLLSQWVQPVQGQGFVDKADTTQAPNWLRDRNALLSLPTLPVVAHAAHFRLSTFGTLVEGWQSPTGSYGGQVLIWVHEYSPTDAKRTNRVHVVTRALDSDTVRALFGLLTRVHLRALPDWRDIAGWRPSADGGGYTLEYATPATYAVKSYLNPALQGALPEAQRVLLFVRQAMGVARARALRQTLNASIPFKCYYMSEATIMCRGLSALEEKKYERAKKRQWRVLPRAIKRDS